MCGNAVRCIGKYLYDNGIVGKRKMTLETLGGIKTLELSTHNGLVSSVRVDMGAPVLTPSEIPVNLTGDKIVDQAASIDGKDYKITCLSLGNPYAVVFCDSVEALDVAAIGPQFEYNPLFPDRINVVFVEVSDRNHIKMRVWERGSGETQSCGSGACAAVVAAVLNGHCDMGADVKVRLSGGDLMVRCTSDTVYLTGDCHTVFEGVIEL